MQKQYLQTFQKRLLALLKSFVPVMGKCVERRPDMIRTGKILVTAVLLILYAVPAASETARYGFTNKLKMKFIYIPPGAFQMGSPLSEIGRDDDEVQHTVMINNGFFISATEVTQGQWRQLMDSNPSHFAGQGDDYPVEQVSWNDCQAFIQQLNEKEGTDKYRLPTEAEWEYACRAGSTTAFANGENTGKTCEIIPHLDETAWYCGNSSHLPQPVGTKKPNAWGLYDMHGNVQEWCLDSCEWQSIWTRRASVHTDTYQDQIADPRSTTGIYRIFRGGSWTQSARYARSADRGFFRPSTRRTYIGFRVVKTK